MKSFIMGHISHNVSLERMPVRRNGRGFTLIELLVVIAIIAILASILFPVFARARENARRSSCQSNMKQIGLAFMQYSQDFDERMPVGTVLDNACEAGFPYGSRGFGWAGQLYPYAKSSQVFKCPSDPTRDSANGIAMSYAYNEDIPSTCYIDNTNPRGVYGAISKFNAPARTVLLTEYQGGGTAARVSDSEFGGSNGPNNSTSFLSGVPTNLNLAANVTTYVPASNVYLGAMVTGPAKGADIPNWTFVSAITTTADAFKYGVHLQGSNYLCADGHVKWFRSTNVSFGRPAVNPTDAASPWNTDPYRAEGTGSNQFAITFSAT